MDTGAADARAAARAWLFRPETYALVRRWLRLLHVPRRLREDIAQGAMLGAWEDLGSYDPARGPVERWFNRLVVFSAEHETERRWNRLELVPLEEVALALASAAPLPDDQLVAEEARRLVRALVASLPHDCRDVIEQHELDGVPLSDVARGCGRSESGIYKRRARALALLTDRARRLMP